MSNQVVEWSACAVRKAIAESGLTKTQVSEATGIPYSTLNRKVAGLSEFSLTELYRIACALRVSPSVFTPPAFWATSATVGVEASLGVA